MTRRRGSDGSRALRIAIGLTLVGGLAGLALWLVPRSTADGGRAAAGTTPEASVTEQPRRLTARVLAVYPHDPRAWTQGLLWHDGWLYESTGRYGESSLRRVRLSDGTVDRKVDLDRHLFGEGLARVEDRLVQLTWRSGVGLRYSLEELAPLPGFSYPGEGWGLCFDGRLLVRSDGSSKLFFHHPETLEIERTLAVERDGRPLESLNELECAEGWVYANLLGSDAIVRIDPATGGIDAVIDASGLLSSQERAGADVLNGIAYYPPNQSFLLTGKLWPKLFEVVFVAG